MTVLLKFQDFFFFFHGINSARLSLRPLTECSSESEVCEVMTGLKLLGEMGLNFFLMALICSRARNAEGAGNNKTYWSNSDIYSFIYSSIDGLWSVSECFELTQPADGAAVGLVAQCVCAGIAQTQVSAGQDECVAHVRQAHHTLGAVVTDLVIGHLQVATKSKSQNRMRRMFFFHWCSQTNRSRQEASLILSPLIPGCCICSQCRRSPAVDNSRRPPAESKEEVWTNSTQGSHFKIPCCGIFCVWGTVVVLI